MDVKQQINYSANLIKNGGIVAFPTETVYGIGADVYNEEAIKKIYSIKNRPHNNPLIAHISDLNQLNKLVDNYTIREKMLMDAFWPGPLTILFKKSKFVPDIVTAGSEFVAIRMPHNKIALDLIKLSKTPLVAPSANPSGKPSSTHHNHVFKYFEDKIFCIEGGKTNIGIESTVISLHEYKPTILRYGGVTKKDLENILNETFVSFDKLSNKILSPGLLHKHYSPNAKLMIIDTIDSFNIKINYYSSIREKIGILASDQTITNLNLSDKNIVVKSLGSKNNLLEISNNLFSKLLEFDDTNVEIILAEQFIDLGLGKAIMDKLERASQK